MSTRKPFSSSGGPFSSSGGTQAQTVAEPEVDYGTVSQDEDDPRACGGSESGSSSESAKAPTPPKAKAPTHPKPASSESYYSYSDSEDDAKAKGNAKERGADDGTETTEPEEEDPPNMTSVVGPSITKEVTPAVAEASGAKAKVPATTPAVAEAAAPRSKAASSRSTAEKKDSKKRYKREKSKCVLTPAVAATKRGRSHETKNTRR